MRHVTPPTAASLASLFPLSLSLSSRFASALTPFITPPALPPWPPPPLARRADDDGDGVDDAQRDGGKRDTLPFSRSSLQCAA